MEQTQNIPKLRFPEFDEKWEKKMISEIFNVSAGGDISSENVRDVKSELFQYPIYANAEKNKGLYGYSNIYKIEGGVVTVAGRGVNIGIAHARNHRFYPIVRLLVLKPKKNQNIYFFENAINKFNVFVESTGVPQLTAPQFSNYKLAYPTLPEQTKIATFLTAVDNKIQQLTKKKSLLEQYKKGVMQQIFSQEIRFKDDDGKEFPEWEKKKLGDVFKELTESAGKQSIDTYSISAGYGFVSQKEKFGKDISGQQNEKYVVVYPNQFSYNKGNSKTFKYGCVYLNRFDFPITVPNVFISFKLIEGSMIEGYFEKLFENHYLDKGLRQIISSSARMDGLLNVNKKYFFDLKIPLPTSKEQQKIASFLTTIDHKIEQVNTQLEKTKAFKKGLLQQMFV